jgi:alkylation response protein AidB-like acyl-CoA dehydrogenase
LVGQSELACEALECLDQTRRQARLTADGLQLPRTALIASGGDAEARLQSCLDRAAAALACEQVGLAQACVDESVSYAKTRKQFGEVIGRFQAIKHLIADMYTELEAARSAAYYALWCADHEVDSLPFASASAKTLGNQASFHCAGQNIQVHGGIGFTWEHSAHLYFKRAQANKNLLGDSHQHLERAATLLGLSGGS